MTLTSPDLDTVAQALDATVPEEASALYRPRYNVAPTDLHWIARTVGGGRELAPAHWGLVLGKRGPVINVRVESAPGQLREAWRGRRCVVPADGFYEWTGTQAARRPIWFHPTESGLLYLAGLYDEQSAGHLTFTILTAPAERAVAAVHDRMPLLLPRALVDAWLAGARLDTPPPVALAATPVSARVNKPENDDPQCLVPDERGQTELFK